MKVALYTNELAGHPEVYVRNISQILLRLGHKVLIITQDSNPVRDWQNSRSQLEDHVGIQLVMADNGINDLSEERKHKWVIDQLKVNEIELLLLIDADRYQDKLTTISKGNLPKFPCFSAGIFSVTAEWCPGESFYFQPPLSLTRRFRHLLGAIKRYLLSQKSRQYIFFEEVVMKGDVLDLIIIKDERILEHKSFPFVWMPDIFEGPTDVLDQDGFEAEQEISLFLDGYDESSSSELLLFYGSGAWYKGYDYFLKLASMDPEIIALHIGSPERNEPGKSWDFDTKSLREQLQGQGRLFETSVFASPSITHKAFSKIRRFVSFHRLSGSSGTVLQSLAYGKPVLTPDSGLIGHRTKTHNTGLTYKPLDMENLFEQWKRFKSVSPSKFELSIKSYSSSFSQAAVEGFINDLLCRYQECVLKQ